MVVYLRFVRVLTFFFIALTLLNVIFVLPTNASGPFRSLPANDTSSVRGLGEVSLANIESGSQTLWVHFFSVVLTTLAVLYALWVEYRHYAALRHEANVDGKVVRNYAVRLRDMKLEECTEAGLTAYVEGMFPGLLRLFVLCGLV